MMYGKTTASLSGRTGSRSGSLTGSSGTSPLGFLVIVSRARLIASLRCLDGHRAWALALVLDPGERHLENAAVQLGDAAVTVDRVQELHLATESTTPGFDAEET